MASILRAPVGSTAACATLTQIPHGPSPGPDRHVDPPGHRHACELLPWHGGRRGQSRWTSGAEEQDHLAVQLFVAKRSESRVLRGLFGFLRVHFWAI